MENQHRHIKGYRDLSAEEIMLMNAIKAHEQATEQLCAEVRLHLKEQSDDASQQATDGDRSELARLSLAEPGRWASIGRTHFQEGFMALVRAVAQPGSPA